MTSEQKVLVWGAASSNNPALWHHTHFPMELDELSSSVEPGMVRALCGEIHAQGWIFQTMLEPGEKRCGRCFPTNPYCAGTVGKNLVACGEEDYYCSNRCWTISRLRAARDLVAEYERQLAVYASRDPMVKK